MKDKNHLMPREHGPPIHNFIMNSLKTSVMKPLFISFLFVITFITTDAQLTKNNWLVGGNGKFFSYKSEFNSANYSNEAKYTQIDLSASVGYFVIDKLSLGLRPTFSSIKGKVTTLGGGSTNVQRYWIGPYGRYYFLSTENQYNILADIAYQFGLFNAGGERGDLRTFSALAGPVIYFNTSVGIEFLVGYSYTKEDVEQAYKDIRKGFQIGVGFQIHLEK